MIEANKQPYINFDYQIYIREDGSCFFDNKTMNDILRNTEKTIREDIIKLEQVNISSIVPDDIVDSVRFKLKYSEWTNNIKINEDKSVNDLLNRIRIYISHNAIIFN